MTKQMSFYIKLKRNPLIVFAFNKSLDWMCRNVKAYIFVATTGRSGTVTLSKIFQSVDGAVCFHEPSPVMFNDYQPGTDRMVYFDDLFYKLKRIYIKRNAKRHSYYIETNHQFVKNFIAPAIKCFNDKIKIIHLVRDPVSVASSFYQVNTIPAQDLGAGALYLIDPREEGNLIAIDDLLYGSKEFSHDLYKCLWYWYEVEARTKAAKNRYPHICFYPLKTEDLNNKQVIMDMFDKLGMPVNHKKLDPLIGMRANTRLGEKTKKVDLEECKSMNAKLLEQMERRYGKDFWVS